MLKSLFWCNKLAKDAVNFAKNCLHCTSVKYRKPGRKIALKITHLKRIFSQIAFGLQKITQSTMSGNIKEWEIFDVFTRFVRSKAIADEKSRTIARVLM